MAIQDDGHTCIGGGNGSEVQKKTCSYISHLELAEKKKKDQPTRHVMHKRWEMRDNKIQNKNLKKKFSPSSNALAILEYELE